MSRPSLTGHEPAHTRFRGADGPLTLDGEVATATLGVDSRWGRWHAGMALASDAPMTNTTSDAVEKLVEAGGATSRVRVMLEGSGSMPLAGGGIWRQSR